MPEPRDFCQGKLQAGSSWLKREAELPKAFRGQVIPSLAPDAEHRASGSLLFPLGYGLALVFPYDEVFIPLLRNGAVDSIVAEMYVTCL